MGLLILRDKVKQREYQKEWMKTHLSVPENREKYNNNKEHIGVNQRIGNED